MKKITLLAVFSMFLLHSAIGQASKWSITMAPGASIGGPNGSLAKKMRQQQFNETENITFIFLSADINYPIKSNEGSLMFKATKKQKEYRSLYLTAGFSGGGHIEGFRKDEDYMIFPLIGGSTGTHINIDHKTWLFAAGYQYSFPKTRATVALAPGIFLFHYKLENEGNPMKETRFVPGMTSNVRLPLGKEKRRIGFEVFMDLNLAPPVKMKDMNVKGDQFEATFKPGNVNLVHANMGVAIAFRKR